MHVPNAAEPLSHLRGEPVKEASVRHSLAGTKVLAPPSEGHAKRSANAAISDLELSLFALSTPARSDASTHISRLPLSSSTLAQWQPKQSGLHLRHPSYGCNESNQSCRDNVASRRDSAYWSSPCRQPDHGSFSDQPHLTNIKTSIVAKHTHNDKRPNLQAANFQSHRPTEVDLNRESQPRVSDDTVSGAESTPQRTSANRVRQGSFLPSQNRPGIRTFTSSLGLPKLQSPALSTRSSVEIISDAGDQQHLHQRRSPVQQEDSFEDSCDITESLASLPPPGSRHDLQKELLDARLSARNSEGQIERFIPKKELWRIINKDSVRSEITKELSDIASFTEIKSHAKTVCQDVETTELRSGKTKIKSFRKIFALLVLVEATSSITEFLAKKHGVSDQDLPLTLGRRKGVNELYRRGDENKVPLPCFKHAIWSPIKLENFQKYQWWLLAPFFSPDEDGVVKHYILKDEHILPYVIPEHSEENVADKVGGYGKVLMVHIHPDHHNFRDIHLCNRGFAVKKQLYDVDRDAFKREAEILRKFSGERSHPHVVSLLATYEQFKKIHLVFYRAQGDLFEFWKEIEPRPEFTYGNILWVVTQCAGIAEGLAKLHKLLSFPHRDCNIQEAETKDTHDGFAPRTGKRVRILPPLVRVGTDSSMLSNGVREGAASPVTVSHQDEPLLPNDRVFHGDHDPRRKKYGRHGDINPGNILWYDDSDEAEHMLTGTLKIADFGQAEVNSYLSKTKRRDVANTLTYRPPECDAQPSIIRQPYDIWCLGCVYLEFVSWLLGGSSLVIAFSRKRMTPDVFQCNRDSDTFFQVDRNPDTLKPEFMIKPAVSQFIDELHEHHKCTLFLHDLLDMIQHNMLVIKSNERKPCAGIYAALDEMLRKCQDDKDYATSPNPWCFSKRPALHSVQLGMTPDAEEVIEKNLPRGPNAPAQAAKAPAVQPAGTRKSRISRIPRRCAP